MVVMGITWIIGLAVVEIKELLSIAYIFTVVVAFQGLFIFLALVLFTKSVRDEIVKCGKNEYKKRMTTLQPDSSKVNLKENCILKF